MPYKFKDDGSNIIKPFQKKIYLIIGLIFISQPIFNYILFSEINIMQIITALLSVFMIWGVNKNGFYKIARWYMERKIRRFDNKWR